MTQSPLVSIVTPVYNGGRHLRECIESVLAQTYTNWDYTIVNNCSTDRTLEIASEYAQAHSRIRIWNSDTLVPVEASYNNAFRQSSPDSKYTKVVAADDALFPECLEKMVALAEANPNVAIVGAYGLIGEHVFWEGLPYSSPVVIGRELCRARLLGGPYIFGTATSLLFRSSVVRRRSAFYNEANLHCDSEACLEVLEDADFGFVHQVLTRQGTRDDSLTSFSQRMQTYLPWVLLELVKYGPKFLTPLELKTRIQEHLAAYYRYLGEQTYKRRGREFWEYHRSQLSALGYPLNSTRLAAAAGSYALDFLNPRVLAREVARPVRKVLGMFSPRASRPSNRE